MSYAKILTLILPLFATDIVYDRSRIFNCGLYLIVKADKPVM